MKRTYFILVLLTLPVLGLFAQVSYDDVAVIINDNDDRSVEIGEYFAQERNIPQGNLVYIQCPSVELIDSAGFVDIRQQIEERFIMQGLVDKVSYLVTTKGIPFNVRKSESCEGLDGVKYCTSLDSELSLLFSEWSQDILSNGSVQNPYYDESVYFDRGTYGIYLVTRLDAYTVEDAKTMIDRSGPGIEIAKSSAQFIVDFSYVTDTTIKKLFTDFVQPAVNYLILNDWHVVFDPSDDLLTNEADILGYFNINYQPANKELDFTWLKGSLSEIFLTTGNLTFNKEQNVFNELSVPDLLEEGASSSSTYANGPFFSQVIQLPTLYKRYLGEGQQPPFNLAESYFMAMPTLSNQYLVLGDPKTSLNIQQSNADDVDHTLKSKLYPNPAMEDINITFNSEVPGMVKMQVSDITGRVVYLENMNCNKGIIDKHLDLSVFPEGIYFVTLTGPGVHFRKMKFIKTGK